MIKLRRMDHTIIVTLNRPEKLNAFNTETLDMLEHLLDSVETDSALRSVIVTGEGERAFSAGADIAEMHQAIAADDWSALMQFVRKGKALFSRIENFSKPVIAAVNGLAYGGGCEFVEAAALAISADTAQFSKAEIDIGVLPFWGGTQRLPRLIGRKRALEAILTAKTFTAEQALNYGLLNKVVPSKDVLNEALELASCIAQRPAEAVHYCLFSLRAGLNASLTDGLEIEHMAAEALFRCDAPQDGITAFINRNRPDLGSAHRPEHA